MATCTQCGAELKPGAKFCENCGAKVSAPQPANAEAIRITHIASIVCRNDFIICSILSFDHRLFCKDYYTIRA